MRCPECDKENMLVAEVIQDIIADVISVVPLVLSEPEKQEERLVLIRCVTTGCGFKLSGEKVEDDIRWD